MSSDTKLTDDLLSQWKGWDKKLPGYKAYVQEWEKKITAFLQFNPEQKVPTRPGESLESSPLPASATSLAGLPFAVKDNIAVEGFKLTCGSKMLQNLEAPYTATCVKRLLSAGAKVVGKTNLDEFGMGSSTDNSALAQTNNPWDTERVPGGSSGGSAAAVAAGQVPFALGTDTGGSVRQPAAFCGVYGLKPTYGVVSRYGLTAYASSLEVLGIMARTAGLTRLVFDTVKAKDVMDQTSLQHEGSSGGERGVIGIIKGLSDLEPETDAAYQKMIATLKKLGREVREIQLDTLDYVVPAYYTIATAEASANLARFNGIRYGERPFTAENPEELIRKARAQGFGDEVKTRIMLGTYVLRSGFQDQYYTRAQKVRTAIRQDFDRAFEGVDMILSPAFPSRAFDRGQKGLSQFQQRMADKFTCSANLAGLPALAIPAGVEGNLPVGMQLMAPVFQEDRLLSLAEELEALFPAPEAPGYSTEWRS